MKILKHHIRSSSKIISILNVSVLCSLMSLKLANFSTDTVAFSLINLMNISEEFDAKETILYGHIR